MVNVEDVVTWIVLFSFGVFVTLLILSGMYRFNDEVAVSKIERMMYMENLPEFVSYRVNENMTIKDVRELYNGLKPMTEDYLRRELRLICR